MTMQVKKESPSTRKRRFIKKQRKTLLKAKMVTMDEYKMMRKYSDLQSPRPAKKALCVGTKPYHITKKLPRTNFAISTGTASIGDK